MTDFDVQAWHEWRRGGVGGSDIAALIGLSNYASPTSLFYEKAGLLERDEESPRQRIGKRMEAVLAAEFNDATGLFVAGEQTWCQHSEYPWARCTVDGFVADSPYGSPGVDGDLSLGTWEAKTDARFGWTDGVPPNIRAQCVWQMGVTQLQHCWITVMFGGFRIEIFEVHWDDDVQSDWAFMLDAARTFWTEHVQTGTPPPVDDHWATTEALTQVNRPPEGPCPACEGRGSSEPVFAGSTIGYVSTICGDCKGAGTVSLVLEADDDARELVTSVQRAMTVKAAAEATETRLKNELRARLGHRTDLVDGWKTVGKRDPKQVPVVIASWREQQSERIDPELVRTLAPAELIEKCTTTSTSRVLRVPKPKENSE